MHRATAPITIRNTIQAVSQRRGGNNLDLVGLDLNIPWIQGPEQV